MMVGRPPGSRNKPKLPTGEEITSALRAGMAKQGPVYNSVIDPFLTAPPANPAWPQLRVLLSMRGQAWGDPADETLAEWPQEWPLPRAGEAVHLSKTFGGIVEYVDYRLDSRQIVVKLR